MLRTLDIVLIGVMTVAATITYTIKHHADLKLQDVRKLEAEIQLEKDTIDLLKADWALLTQPNRLEKMVRIYDRELHLAPTDSTQLVQPSEMPKLKAELTPEELEAGDKARIAALKANSLAPQEVIRDVANVAPKDKPSVKTAKADSHTKKAHGDKKIAQAKKTKLPKGTDQIETGSVKR